MNYLSKPFVKRCVCQGLSLILIPLLFRSEVLNAEIQVDSEGNKREIEQHADRILIAHVDHMPRSKSLIGYFLLEDGTLVMGDGVSIEQRAEGDGETSRIIWAMKIPPEVRDVQEVVFREEGAQESPAVYHLNKTDFFISTLEGADAIRQRIQFLRRQQALLQQDRAKLERLFESLRKDAHVIGQYDRIQGLERAVQKSEWQLQQTQGQTQDIERELIALKKWQAPIDVRERKQTYVKDVQELQRRKTE